ncbi:hypothetical protein A6V36_17060 [Paraburkholderia ginsengiterrae]|uniref:Uncharacterized protein n=1 Tax=Paraburkholderia ginsengiterrae TaxID=1462993 RepID=A0A1A9N1Q2_9BURK|nr:hypothetical protein [Paraburkholderia ginsengiterrae]OAJ54223.1 hypothetical protein A6V37_34725 [Paraburkholderia ginsengiterrae]OAJ63897.1 hypothetical protein A6V36_17060 [Paraburkholderia ginsengiterrae]
MFDDTGLPNSARDAMAGGSATDGVAPAAGPPPRFGRLALCVAAMSALAIGVMGTVAYGVWFNHDQQAYAAAIVGARQALGTSASATAGKVAVAYPASAAVAPAAATTVLAKSQPPAVRGITSGTTPGATPSVTQVPVMDPEPGGPLASYSGQVVGRSAQPAQVVVTANAAPAASASSSASARPAASSGNPPAQQVASVRPGKEGRATPQEHRANARHKDSSLFARVGQFLRRVSYRQHGNPNPSRQDNYSHP